MSFTEDLGNPLYIGFFLAAIVTSAVSATLGMAGGLLLLNIMTLGLDLKDAIPLHGFTQLLSNLGRIGTSWRSIHWKLTFHFALLVIPGAIVGIKAAGLLNRHLLEIVVSLVILWIIHGRQPKSVRRHNPSFFIFLGFASAVIGMIAGATGPLIVPFFMGIGLKKNEMIATKAICQGIIQFVKIPTFILFSNLDLGHYRVLLFVLGSGVILGSLFGKRLLEILSEAAYEALIRWSITGLSIYQILAAGFALKAQFNF